MADGMITDDNDRRTIARLLAKVVDKLAETHTKRGTQEPPITSRIAEALERERANLPCGTDVEITTLDIDDRGSNSLESIAGADLYLNITVRENGREMRKAILIQAKHRDRWKHGLADQCSKMRKRCDACYGWIYTDTGVRVVAADEIIQHPKRRWATVLKRTAEEVFESIFACREGDPSRALPRDKPVDQALRDLKQELRVERAADVSIKLDGVGEPTTSTRSV